MSHARAGMKMRAAATRAATSKMPREMRATATRAAAGKMRSASRMSSATTRVSTAARVSALRSSYSRPGCCAEHNSGGGANARCNPPHVRSSPDLADNVMPRGLFPRTARAVLQRTVLPRVDAQIGGGSFQSRVSDQADAPVLSSKTTDYISASRAWR